VLRSEAGRRDGSLIRRRSPRSVQSVRRRCEGAKRSRPGIAGISAGRLEIQDRWSTASSLLTSRSGAIRHGGSTQANLTQGRQIAAARSAQSRSQPRAKLRKPAALLSIVQRTTTIRNQASGDRNAAITAFTFGSSLLHRLHHARCSSAASDACTDKSPRTYNPSISRLTCCARDRCGWEVLIAGLISTIHCARGAPIGEAMCFQYISFGRRRNFQVDVPIRHRSRSLTTKSMKPGR
jgi:hypothetical protein